MHPLAPIDTAHLFQPLLEELLGVLRALGPADWLLPTLAPRWRVRDVAAHLLDGDLRKLAVYRDGHALPLTAPLDSNRAVVEFVNELNAVGARYAERLSPRLIVDLLELTGAWVAELMASLPPEGPSLFAVSWAGEEASQNWMDTGREYTERWHHQMQIREAVGAPPLLARRWFEPVVEMSVRALPPAFASLDAPPGTTASLTITDACPGSWSVVRHAGGWGVFRGRPGTPDAEVEMSSDDVWRLWFNALTPEGARSRASSSGDDRLVMRLLGARAVLV